jgi:hypothetical protein
MHGIEEEAREEDEAQRRKDIEPLHRGLSNAATAARARSHPYTVSPAAAARLKPDTP